MMFDRLLQVSASQVVTANAASTDVIDLGSNSRRVGPGEPLWLVLVMKAVSGTSPTLQVALQTDDNSGFSSAATLLSSAAEAGVAGKSIVMSVPMTNERFLRANYTVGGTSPSFTVDCFLTNQEPPSWVGYPDAIA